MNLHVFWNSFYLSAVTTLLCLVIGYPFAYLIARADPRVRPYLLLLVIVPFWTSSLVRTYAMIVILNTNGLLNTLLQALGLIDEPLELLYTDGAVIAGLVYTLLPFMVLPLYAAIEKLDWRLVEAARDLGARKVRTFVSVIIPLTSPGIVAGCMLVFLPGLGMFYVADFLGGSKTTLIGNLIQRQFLSARDWPFGSAASVTLAARSCNGIDVTPITLVKVGAGLYQATGFRYRTGVGAVPGNAVVEFCTSNGSEVVQLSYLDSSAPGGTTQPVSTNLFVTIRTVIK